jgi:hypothetical protein
MCDSSSSFPLRRRNFSRGSWASMSSRNDREQPPSSSKTAKYVAPSSLQVHISSCQQPYQASEQDPWTAWRQDNAEEQRARAYNIIHLVECAQRRHGAYPRPRNITKRSSGPHSGCSDSIGGRNFYRPRLLQQSCGVVPELLLT